MLQSIGGWNASWEEKTWVFNRNLLGGRPGRTPGGLKRKWNRMTEAPVNTNPNGESKRAANRRRAKKSSASKTMLLTDQPQTKVYHSYHISQVID